MISVMSCCAVSLPLWLAHTPTEGMAVSTGGSRDDVSPLHLSLTGSQFASGNIFNLLLYIGGLKIWYWVVSGTPVSRAHHSGDSPECSSTAAPESAGGWSSPCATRPCTWVQEWVSNAFHCFLFLCRNSPLSQVSTLLWGGLWPMLF